MQLTKITSSVLALMLMVTPALAHEDHLSEDVTIQTDIPTGAAIIPTEVPAGSAIIQSPTTDIEDTYPTTPNLSDNSATVPSYYNSFVGISAQGGREATVDYLAMTDTDYPITPGPVSQQSGVPTHDPEVDDITLTETNIVSGLYTDNADPEATPLSLPVFTYGGDITTDTTDKAGTTFEASTLTNISMPTSKLVATTTPTYTNGTDNATTSHMETLPTTLPNSAGSVTPFLVSIAPMFIVMFLVMCN